MTITYSLTRNGDLELVVPLSQLLFLLRLLGLVTLGTGVIRAIFHSLGTTPDLRDLLNNKVKPGAIAPAVNFNMWGEILSGPLDLVTFRETSRSKTSSSVHKRSSGNKSG